MKSQNIPLLAFNLGVFIVADLLFSSVLLIECGFLLTIADIFDKIKFVGLLMSYIIGNVSQSLCVPRPWLQLSSVESKLNLKNLILGLGTSRCLSLLQISNNESSVKGLLYGVQHLDAMLRRRTGFRITIYSIFAWVCKFNLTKFHKPLPISLQGKGEPRQSQCKTSYLYWLTRAQIRRGSSVRRFAIADSKGRWHRLSH